MRLKNSMIVAFAMYSRIPMPKADWEPENMKYSMCFLPMVGLVVGALEVLLFWLCGRLGVSDVLRACLMTALPVWITGGIHMDGFLDTVDAKNSFQPQEKKLEILKDPNVGAFATIHGALYFLLMFGLLYEIQTLRGAVMAGLGFVISRALSGLAVANFKNAPSSSLLKAFSSAAQKKTVTVWMVIWLVMSLTAVGMAEPLGVLTVTIGSCMAFWYYRHMAYRQFGGITGDLAGYFLQVCELMIMAAVVIASRWIIG